MRHRATAPWFAFLSFVSACVHQPVERVAPVALSWTPFYWIRASTESARFDYAGILFRTPLYPNRPPSLVQLDLGGSGSMPEGFPRPPGDSSAIRARREGELHGLLGRGARLEVTGTADPLVANWREEEVGTVGLPNFLRRALVLDFPNRRLAVVASPKELTDLTRATVATVRVDAAELSMAIVPFHLDAERTYRGLLDTGLSPFPLWATFALWRTLTGLNGPDERTRSYVLPNARGDLQFVGARPRRSLRIGDWELHPEEIVYLASGPNGAGLEQWSPPVDAILGPSLFARNTVVIFDIGHRRIGFTRRVTP